MTGYDPEADAARGGIGQRVVQNVSIVSVASDEPLIHSGEIDSILCCLNNERLLEMVFCHLLLEGRFGLLVGTWHRQLHAAIDRP